MNNNKKNMSEQCIYIGPNVGYLNYGQTGFLLGGMFFPDGEDFGHVVEKEDLYFDFETCV